MTAFVSGVVLLLQSYRAVEPAKVRLIPKNFQIYSPSDALYTL
jgi:hypothetical protein